MGVSGFSRLIGGLMVPSRRAHDVLSGMFAIISQFGAVPRKVVWDREGGVGRLRGGRQELTAEFQAFRGVLGIGAVLVGPNDPEAKGVVERANGYLETSFLPGRAFADVTDSTVSSPVGCSGPTSGSTAPPANDHRRRSSKIGQR